MSRTIRINRQQEIMRVQLQNQRAFDLGVEATLTLEEWIENIALFNGLCAYCLMSPFNDLDHIHPVTKGGGTTQDNCVPACQSCNSRKGNRLDGSISTGEMLVEAVARIRFHLSQGKVTISITLFDEMLDPVIRVTPEARKDLKLIAAETGETMHDVVTRLAQQEREQIRKERKPS